MISTIHHFADFVLRHLVLCQVSGFFCVGDLVPAGIKVTGAVLLSPRPGRAGGHPSALGCQPRRSYQSLLHPVKQLMPVLGLVFFRSCQPRFCPLLMSLHLIPEVT